MTVTLGCVTSKEAGEGVPARPDARKDNQTGQRMLGRSERGLPCSYKINCNQKEKVPSDKIRSNKAVSPSNCPTPSGYFFNEKNVLIPAACKSWSCPVCGKVNRNKLMDKVAAADAFLQSSEVPATRKIWRFLTLTQRTTDDTPIMLAFARFRAYLAKHGIKDIRYLNVKEFTKKGKRHLHVLVNSYIPAYTVKHAWYLATDKKSFVVQIKRAAIKSAAGYMTKYMTKNIGEAGFKRRERRYTTSRGFFVGLPKLKADFDKGGSRWEYVFYPHVVGKFSNLLDIIPYKVVRFLDLGVHTTDAYGNSFMVPLPLIRAGCVSFYHS